MEAARCPECGGMVHQGPEDRNRVFTPIPYQVFPLVLRPKAVCGQDPEQKEDGGINSLRQELKDAGLKAAATRSKPACLGVLRGIGFSVAGRLRHAGLEGSCPAPTS